MAAIAIYVGFSLLGELPFDAGETVTLREGLFVLILAPEFYMPLRRLSAAYHDRADAEAAADTLRPLLRNVESGAAHPGIGPFDMCPKITLSGVSCTYEDGRKGLKPVTLSIPAGKNQCGVGSVGIGQVHSAQNPDGFCAFILRRGAGRWGADDRAAGRARWLDRPEPAPVSRLLAG